MSSEPMVKVVFPKDRTRWVLPLGSGGANSQTSAE